MKVKGFKSLSPKALIVKLYSSVSGSIIILLASLICSESNI